MKGSTLLARVAAALDAAGVDYALIGAGALAVHGVARSTFDLDLLTTSPAVLDESTWRELLDGGIAVGVRRGDADDPLAGVVRVAAQGERDVDVVVGRATWQSEAIARASLVSIGGTRVPVVAAADLVLLKLYAGGSQDRWDIEQLLSGPDRLAIVTGVESRIDRLPAPAGDLWRQLLGGR